MAEKKAYAFKNERDLDTAKELIDHYRDYSDVPNARDGEDQKIIFAKVVTLRAGTDDKQCKATEVVYNATTRAYEAPEGTAFTFDSDNIDDDNTTTDLFSSEALEVDEVVEVVFYPDSSGEEQWMARKSGGGSPLYYVEITATTNISTYTVSIYDNPIDRTLVESGVTARAIMHSAGTIPNSASGKGLWATKVGDVYYIINYSVAHG